MPPASRTQSLLRRYDVGISHSCETSFIQKVKDVPVASGESGWITSSKSLLLSSWFNIFWVFPPLAFLAHRLEWDAGLRFGLTFVAIIPLANLLGEATDQLLTHPGQTLSGLKVLFGNAVEVIVSVPALLKSKARFIWSIVSWARSPILAVFCILR
ncbi:hypothetical protein BDV93DRAFT_492657 [Ceratobasidium sp. AG-I]|nr:hypothetical protein BDV93DRAFT_492657 [Ceratobasidium sp. AG-I]